MVSKNCIYFKNEQQQIWFDYGKKDADRDCYIYENSKLISAAFFAFHYETLHLYEKYRFSKHIHWKCQKNDDFSLKINNVIYYIDKNDTNQIKLFNELLIKIF